MNPDTLSPCAPPPPPGTTDTKPDQGLLGRGPSNTGCKAGRWGTELPPLPPTHWAGSAALISKPLTISPQDSQPYPLPLFCMGLTLQLVPHHPALRSSHAACPSCLGYM